MNFSKRSYEKELLDRDDIPFEDIKQNMKELDFINANLGGHKITLNGLKTILKSLPSARKANRTLSILEIGCGGGDNLRIIKDYCTRKKLNVELSGVDINPHCIDFARSRKENHGIKFFTSDYKLVKPEQKPDIIFTSLFCHHFPDNEVIDVLNWMKENSSIGFFINDLQRHPVAYYSIKWLTKFFSKSYLVKNDAPLSVLRGFQKKEWEIFCREAFGDRGRGGADRIHANARSTIGAQLKWKWAFRWLLIVVNE